MGGDIIPSRFPTIIEEGLAAGGIDLPDFPAFLRFLEEQQILDPRFPDRLIARQAPAPEGEEPSVSGDSVAGDSVAGDSLAGDSVAGDSVAAREPGAAEESVPGGDPEVVTDSVAADSVAADSAVAEEPLVAGEPVGGGVPSEGSDRAVDSAGAVSPPGDLPETLAEVPPAETEGGSEGPLTTPEDMGEAADSSAREEAQGSPAPESPEPEQEELRPLGLAEAARELGSMTMWDRFNMDRAGSSVSVLVLLVMVLSLILRGYPPRVRGGVWPAWVIPSLVVMGVGVAAYLSFIEMTHAEAVCGPLGDCNTVNQSEYAFLFGVIPVGVLGLVGYGVIFVLWALGRSGSGDIRQKAALGLWGAVLSGTLFSLYLTFLEPFVIGATCAWCLTSAVVMTLLLWAAAPLAARAWPSGQPSPTSD